MPLTWGAVTGGSQGARIKLQRRFIVVVSFRQLGRSIDRRPVTIDDLAVDGIGFNVRLAQLCTNGYLYNTRNISNAVTVNGLLHPALTFLTFRRV